MKTLKWIAGAALALTSIAAQAQQWPQKPMIFLNPFPAGGGTDTFARPIAAKLSQQLGEQALIENQGGAGGTVGAANAAKRAPDGYNWFFGAVHHTIAESLYTRLQLQPGEGLRADHGRGVRAERRRGAPEAQGQVQDAEGPDRLRQGESRTS